MKNSVILKTAAILCVINIFFALWATWTMSALRSRIVVAEESITNSQQEIASLRLAISTESNVRERNIEHLNLVTKALNQQLNELPKSFPTE